MAKLREDAQHRENYNEAFHEACSRRWKSLQDRRVKQHLMKPTSCRAIRDEDNMSVSLQSLCNLPVVRGQFGHDQPKMFSTIVCSTRKGSTLMPNPASELG